MIIYGGRNGSGLHVGNVTSALDLTVGQEAWTDLPVSVKPPGSQERIGHAFFYDSKRHWAVMIGGVSAYGGAEGFGDVWVLPLDDPTKDWIELTQTNDGPAKIFRYVHGFYEPKADRYYLLGGYLLDSQEQVGYGSSGNMEHIWSLTPNDDGTVTWKKLRTIYPEDKMLHGATVFWNPELNIGYSLHGLSTADQIVPAEWYSEDLRAYVMLEPLP